MSKKLYLIILIAVFFLGVASFTSFKQQSIKEANIFKKVSMSQNSSDVASGLSQFLASINLNWLQTQTTPDWAARHSHAALAFNNEILLMGGIIRSNKTYKNDVWRSGDGITWTKITTSAGWQARINFGAVVFNNKIWVIGGDHYGAYKNDVWYSSDGVSWTQAITSANWPGRYGHATIVYDNKIWVIGGLSNGDYKNDVWYSSDGANWTQATTSANWLARSHHTAVVYDNKIWIIGGNANGTYKNDAWYSSDGINWTEATANAAFSPRYFHIAATYANKMWLMGGSDKETYKNDVWYSADGANWTQATNNAGWSKRIGQASFVFNNKIWIVGGYNPDIAGSYLDDVWSSDMTAPTIDLKINNSDGPISISYNASTTLSWSSTNADSCIASGGWSGAKPTSNAGESISNILATTTYKIVCANGLTDSSDSVVVNVPLVCNENWLCGSWSNCANNQQTKTCADKNKCGTAINKPATTQTCSVETADISEGSLIRAIGGIDVYIVKYAGAKKFKRLILSPSVFNSYSHLKWSDIKTIDKATFDSFVVSDVVRPANDTKVYKLYPQGDTGEKRWIKTEAVFNRMGLDWDSIYTINQIDADSYKTGKVEE